jgi:hypothetical protein
VINCLVEVFIGANSVWNITDCLDSRIINGNKIIMSIIVNTQQPVEEAYQDDNND